MARTRGTEAQPAGSITQPGTAQGSASSGTGRVKTGITTGNTSTASATSPATGPVTGPLPPIPSAPLAIGVSSSMGLHAPAPTPGPVVQPFVTLGRYQLLSRLAIGGMAEVYLARQGELSGFKTLVVVKRVLPNLAVKPDFIAMFLDEARIASMLDHPNIVRITEVGRAGDEYFLAMELVQGKPLAALLQQSERMKTPLPHTLGALMVAHAAAGLHHAHQLTDGGGNPLGLVHRDVSPQNIMVSFEGSVKVIDFGIARALGRLGDTNSGALKGKLGYMAPEQARGEPVDARADIFSLGVVLWECLAGRRLFLRENELATLRAVVYEGIPSVSKYAKVDPTLEVIVEHMLARLPDERFQTAEEVRLALEHWIYAVGGTSTHDLAALMKSWFAADHAQWQRSARIALDMQETDPPMDLAFPNAPGSKSGHSSGSGGLSPAVRSGSHRITWELSGSFPSPPMATPPMAQSIMPAVEGIRQKPRRRAGLIALLLLGLAVGVGAYWAWARQQQGNELVSDPADTKAQVRPMVETLPVAPPQAAPNAPAAGPGERAKPGEPSRAGDLGTAGAEPRKRIRAAGGEKRAIMRPGDSEDSRSTVTEPKRPNRPEPRPNPF